MPEADGVVVVRGGARGLSRRSPQAGIISSRMSRSPAGRSRPGLTICFGGTRLLHVHDDALYARAKQWPLETVVVRLRHSRIHAKDCADCVVRDDTMLDRIDTEVHVSGALTPEQQRRLVEIATGVRYTHAQVRDQHSEVSTLTA